MRISRIVSIAAIAAALTACGGETETTAPAESSAPTSTAAAPEDTAAAPASEASADTVYVDHARDAIESAIALTKDTIEEFKSEGLDTGYLDAQLSKLESQL